MKEKPKVIEEQEKPELTSVIIQAVEKGISALSKKLQDHGLVDGFEGTIRKNIYKTAGICFLAGFTLGIYMIARVSRRRN